MTTIERYERRGMKMKLNTLKLIEETAIRLKLATSGDNLFRLQLLTCFRPYASLRQINNQRKINFDQAF